MKILYAASEATPFAKSGGLADVAGSLPWSRTAWMPASSCRCTAT